MDTHARSHARTHALKSTPSQHKQQAFLKLHLDMHAELWTTPHLREAKKRQTWKASRKHGILGTVGAILSLWHSAQFVLVWSSLTSGSLGELDPR